MDIIKKIALEYSRDIVSHMVSLEQFDSELSSKLLYISKPSEKLRFLSYLKDKLDTDYQNHMKECTSPNSCKNNESYETALYVIQQQYDDYYKIEGGIIPSEKPSMHFFSEGQYFDAYTTIKEYVKLAQKSIVLIDGYVDENTLMFFTGKEPSITLTIITSSKSLGSTFKRESELYTKQYENLNLLTSDNYHDRFLIIDDESFYHIGASIKDAGNKTFMFSKIEGEEIKDLIRSKLRLEFGEFQFTLFL